MSVRIRLTRLGRIHRPFYRIAAFDSRMRRDGAALEYLGFYDPMETTGSRYKLDKEKMTRWVGEGALVSETVQSLCRAEGIALGDPAKKRARNRVRTTKRRTVKNRLSKGAKKAS